MKTFCIKTDQASFQRIFQTKVDENGVMNNSYLFRGVGANGNVAYFVTHGSPDGYFVMDCSGTRKATYSKKEFAFYINGILESNHGFDGINKIVTIECFGGFHQPSVLVFGTKKIEMEPLSKEKAVLWTAWRIVGSSPFYICIAFTPEEYRSFGDDEEAVAQHEANKAIETAVSKIDESKDTINF